MLFPTLKINKLVYKKKFGGGGGGVEFFFFRKTILSHFTFYAIFNIKNKNNIEKCPLHLLLKWEVVSPNSRWGQLESISIISSIPLF